MLNEGCHMSEVAFWNAAQAHEGTNVNTDVKSGISRTSLVPDVTAAARYKHEVTIHQGRIERILEESLRLYSKRAVLRSHPFINFEIDAERNPNILSWLRSKNIRVTRSESARRPKRSIWLAQTEHTLKFVGQWD